MIRSQEWVVAAAVWITIGLGVSPSKADDVQVNTYTSGFQTNPSVAMDADGDFVVVWESFGSGDSDSSSYSIQGQRYASDGSTRGAQFQVNTYTTSSQDSPSVGLDADGDFVVVWASDGSPGTDSTFGSIQGQRYASDGAPSGAQFQVNTYTSFCQFCPSVGLSASGDFVVVWISFGSPDSDSSGASIHGQRYASDGAPSGAQFQVNTYTSSTQNSPSVAIDAGGDFVVVWHSDGSAGTDSSLDSIQGQRYASDGSAVGAELQLNTYTSSYQIRPTVAIEDDGDFVVTWTSYGSSGTDTSGESVQLERFTVCAGLVATIVGTAGDDPALFGTAGDDVIHGLGGNDVIDGLGGNDVICAGDGNDDVTGGEGDDIVFGEDGDDTLLGGPGEDMLLGDAGEDILSGDDGVDFLNGGQDDDRLFGGRDDDMLLGSWGDDELDGGQGVDFLNGHGGDDELDGGDGDDRLLGSRGDDTLVGNLGNDMLEGGPGIDELSGNGGHDMLLGGDGDDLLKGGTDNDSLTGDGGVDVLKGGPGSDVCDGETEIGCEVARGTRDRKDRNEPRR